jgi:hypothetical protein
MGLDNERFGGCVRVQLTSYDRQNYICNELFTRVSRRDNYVANFTCSERRNSRRIHVFALPSLNNGPSNRPV